MTTANNINLPIIISFLLRSRCYRSIRLQYGVNYNCITFLIGCYLFDIIYKRSFTKTSIYKFVGYYSHPVICKYINELIGCNLLAFSGQNKYTITESGVKAIQEISSNKDNYFMTFCQDYNIEL